MSINLLVILPDLIALTEMILMVPNDSPPDCEITTIQWQNHCSLQTQCPRMEILDTVLFSRVKVG